MRIAQIAIEETGALAIGIVRDDGILDFTEAQHTHALRTKRGEMRRMRTVLELLQANHADVETIDNIIGYLQEHRLLEGCVRDPDTVKLLAPVLRPPKIVALGLNYAPHAAETGRDSPTEPILFCKAPTTVIGPGEPILYKGNLTRVDPEAELGVIVGQGGSNIPENRAMCHVAGYTIVNDVTARDMQKADQGKSWPWFRSKSLDTFCPMGPHLVTPEEVPDPVELDLELEVGGEVRQKDNTRNMIFKIPQLIHTISSLMRLEPGDLICTGTPAGIAPIQPGDTVTCRVQGLGELTNPVVAE